MSTRIAIRGITKDFPPRGKEKQTTRAVDAVDLTIEPGELFFLLGPSGCGKTTLLRMLAGFIEPTAGTIHFGERDVTRAAPESRNTGMVFQSYALWPHMTVAANVAFGLDIRRIGQDEKDRRVREALAAVRMDLYADRRPGQLSGGQQQRVALARALVVKPDVLLLDEPLSNLDAKLRADLRVEIRRLCKASGITTVYVTHDQKEALSMADRVAVMRDGKVVQQAPPRELYRRPADRFVAEFLGDTNIIEAEIVGSGPDRLSLSTPAGSLYAEGEGLESHASRDKATICIRPESFSIVSETARDAMAGTRTDTVYLGEIALHTVELDGIGPVRVAEMNPPLAPPAADDNDNRVGLIVQPEDVVVLATA